MKALIIVAILAIAAFIVGPQFVYTIDETEQAIITQFGIVQRTVTTPGLYVKTPFVQQVHRMDKRLLRYDLPPSTLITADKKNLMIDAYARFRIVDPREFFVTVRDLVGAQARMGDIVGSALKKEVASHNQADVVTAKRQQIMDLVTQDANLEALTLGIEVTDVRMKRTDFLPDIATSVYGRMAAERERIAKRYRAEGSEEEAKVKAQADKERTILLADARKRAAQLRGEGDAEAIKIFAAALKQDPEFYAFLRSLEAYKQFLAAETTVVLSADSDLFRYLAGPQPPAK